MKLETAIRRFNEIIDGVETRCMAAEGPVTPTLREMRETELSELWRCVQCIRAGHRTTTIVAGFPRCGSSLVMRMLHSVGVEVAFDSDVSMELREASVLTTGYEWFEQCRGKAVKVLDPHLKDWPFCVGNIRWIWLDRDPLQQAKSHAKLLRTCGMKLTAFPENEIAKSIMRDRDKCFRLMNRIPSDYRSPFLNRLVLRFEDLIDNTLASARVICQFIGRGDADVMAAQVKRRSSDCLPYMLELDQIFHSSPIAHPPAGQGGT